MTALADRKHDVWTRRDHGQPWALIGTFADRTLANCYVDAYEGDWDYKVTPTPRLHLRWGIAAVGYLVAVIGLVIFVTWFPLLSYFLSSR